MIYDSDGQSLSLRNFAATGVSTAFGLCAALTSASLGPEVNAQNAPSTSTNAPAALPEVVVTGEQTSGYQPESVSSPKIVVPLRDVPQTINVVPQTIIQEQNAVSLRDVLRNVPGISFQAGEGGVPAGDQLAIRGFGARTDIFIDGVRDIGGYTRDSFNLESVEVFKGPNSTYSGRGSTGGSVNIVSKTPKLNPFYNGELSYGSYDYYRGTVDFNQPIPQLDNHGLKGSAVRLNALYHDQDFSGRDYVHDNRWAFNPTIATGLGTDTRFTLSYLHLQENNLAGYGLPFVNTSTNAYGGFSALGKVAPLPFHRFFGLVNRDYEDIVNDIAGLRFEHDFNEDLKIQNNTRYARTYRDSIISSPRFVLPVQPTPPGVSTQLPSDPIFGPNTAAAGNAAISGVNGIEVGLNHQLQSRDQVSEIIANQTDFRANFDSGRFEHAVVASLEYARENEKNYLRTATGGPSGLTAQTSNPLNPDPFSPHHAVARSGAYNEATSDNAALSVFDTMKISDQWILSGGARGDIFSTEYNQRSATGGLTTFDRTDIEPTWRTGLAYKPLPYGSIFFGFGTSFNPSAEGLTLTGPTEALPPEFGKSFELGTKWDLLNERLSLSAAMFRTDKDNYRNTDPITSITEVTGEVRVQGVEFGVAGDITEHWSVYAGYALMESEILKSKNQTVYNGVAIREQGQELNNTPSQTFNFHTTYELPFKVDVGTAFFFVDERFSNTINTQGVPSYWLHDVFATWHVTKNVDLRLNVANLWDEEYIDRVGGGHAIPGSGRTVIATAAFKF